MIADCDFDDGDCDDYDHNSDCDCDYNDFSDGQQSHLSSHL